MDTAANGILPAGFPLIGNSHAATGGGETADGQKPVSGYAVMDRETPGPGHAFTNGQIVDEGQAATLESPLLEGSGRGIPEHGTHASTRIRNALECLLLARGGPVRVSELRKILDVDEAELRGTLATLQVEYVGRGLQVQEVAGGFQLCTRPEYGAYVQRLLRLDEMEPLTRATLEVLAIVAYRQPVTRAEVDVVRGVQSVHHMMKLQDRRLICEVGRRPGPGRPILYGTTEGFLRYFGLRDLTQLPPLEGQDGAPSLPSRVP